MTRLGYSACALALGFGAPVAAQTVPADTATPAAAGPAAAADDGAILVTARRRAENVQDVPIAITSVDAATLENTGSYNVNRLIQLIPTVQFFTSNPRNSAINIRGLGAPFGLTNDGIEQGVGLYIDQVYYSRPAAASFDFIDVERIEVLRGPQGTLYGKNTTAGALNITTRRPSFTPEGRIELTGGNYTFLQGKASVSGPLIADRLAARVAVTGTSRQGTLINVANGRRVNEQKNVGVRGSLLYRASDSLDLTLHGDFNHQDPECCAQLFVRVVPTLRAANRQFDGLARAFGYAPPSRDPFDRRADVDSELQARQNFGGASLLAEWDVGPGTLTSVTAWRFWDWFPANDRDFIGLPITTVSANQSKQRQLTQEFRFASSGERRFDYVFGLFAYRQVIDTNGAQEQGSAASLWLLGPAQGFNPALLDGLRQETTVHFVNNSLAAFGQVTWNVTDRLRIQPGLRLNYDDKTAEYDAVISGGLANPTPAQRALQLGILAPQAYDAKLDDTNVSGDINVSYRLTDDVLGYATFARSFKTGGVNLGGLPTDAAGQPALAVATVDPESVDHYEVGLKTSFLDKRVTLNLALFQTEIEDYQTTVINGQVGVLRGYLANADTVRVRGVEADLTARPSERVSLYASVGYTDGEYVSFVDAPCAVEFTGGQQVCDISGQELPGISEWALSYGGQYALPIGDERVYLGVDASYRSSFSSNPTPSPFLRVDGYSVFNFRAGYEGRDGWNAFAWVRNAFDEGYFDFLSVQPGNSGLIVGQPADPRTYGLTVRKQF